MSGIPSDIPNFQILSVWILVLGHYLFIRACSFSWALLSNVLGVGVMLILEPDQSEVRHVLYDAAVNSD